MYGFITLLIVMTIVNLAVSTNRLRMYEGTIYITELLLIGVVMTFCSLYLITLMNSLFGQNFVDEKHTLKLSLVVFDITYLLRAAFCLFLRLKLELYKQLWGEHAFLIASLYIGV